MRLNNFPAKTLAKKKYNYKLPKFIPGVVVVASKSTYICQLIIFIYKFIYLCEEEKTFIDMMFYFIKGESVLHNLAWMQLDVFFDCCEILSSTVRWSHRKQIKVLSLSRTILQSMNFFSSKLGITI